MMFTSSLAFWLDTSWFEIKLFKIEFVSAFKWEETPFNSATASCKGPHYSR